MAARNEESPEPRTQSFQKPTTKTTEESFSQRKANVNGHTKEPLREETTQNYEPYKALWPG